LRAYGCSWKGNGGFPNSPRLRRGYEDSSRRFLDHLAWTAFRADSDLSSGVMFAARALPPFKPPRRPRIRAEGKFGSALRSKSDTGQTKKRRCVGFWRITSACSSKLCTPSTFTLFSTQNTLRCRTNAGRGKCQLANPRPVNGGAGESRKHPPHDAVRTSYTVRISYTRAIFVQDSLLHKN
jgi:hypothetical protein